VRVTSTGLRLGLKAQGCGWGNEPTSTRRRNQGGSSSGGKKLMPPSTCASFPAPPRARQFRGSANEKAREKGVATVGAVRFGLAPHLGRWKL
jgi:hypothetical protein